MLTIDGSMGEGGGQVLRTSLGLSALTGTPFRIINIRKHRAKPGLARQHLTAVKAATAICNAEVTGASMRSTELTFRPGTVVPGDYQFAIGTAGSAALVLQTVLPPLMMQDRPSLLTLEGGTHNSKAPSVDYLQTVFAPLLAEIGPTLEIDLETHGFYPAGGGKFTAAIEPAPLEPFERMRRGPLITMRPHALVSLLSKGVGRREIKAICEHLGLGRPFGKIESVSDPRGPGNALLLTVEHEAITEQFTGFGEKGKPAETVAAEVAKEVHHYLDSDAPVGEHLADQLLIPMALAGEGVFRTSQPSLHTTTNAKVIGTFLDVEFSIVRKTEKSWEIRC